MNEPDYFWKNFRLGTELQISGSFIFNSLYFLDKLEYLRNEEDIFEFLYNASVGIERIQKILIVMSEHNEDINQLEFEKSLITHNHLELLKRIAENHRFKFGKVHTKFLGILSDFYNSYRYKRFMKSSVFHKNFDKYELLNFLSKELKIEIVDDDYVRNSQQIKKFLGKLLSKIVCDLYEAVRIQARKIGTFTYEIRYNSKAFKIFIAKEYTFENEANFKREILISLMNANGLSDDFSDYIKSLIPIPLEEYNSSHYIKYLFNSVIDQNYISEYEYMIDEKSIPKKRIEEIEPIGESQYIDSDFDFLNDIEIES